MSVTFGTPVNTVNSSLVLSGVSLGQPIVLLIFGDASPTISDTFATPYTWTMVEDPTLTADIYAFNGGDPSYASMYIGTGGYGSSGTIRVGESSVSMSAIPCIGASGAAGLAAVDVHGHSTGNSTTAASPSLTPTATGEGAVYGVLSADSPSFVTLASGPGSPWTTTTIGPIGPVNYGAVSTYPSPPASALTTSWTITNLGDYPSAGNYYIAMGAVLKAFTATAPSAPTNQLPANASYQDVSGGILVSGIYNPTDNVPSSFQSLRMKLTGGTYGYWNGTDFSNTTQQWFANTTLPGQTFSVFIPNGVAVPGGTFSNAHTFNWSFASEESAGSQRGSFAGDFTLVAQAGAVTTISAPANGSTVHGTTQPTVTWSSTYPSGATQTGYQIIVESGSFGTTPGSGVSAWNSGAVASTILSTPVAVALTPGVPYAVFVQVTETGAEPGAWVRNTFTLQVDTPAAPTVVAIASTDAVTGQPLVQLTVQGDDNLLTANQSSLESDVITGWQAGPNTALAASATWSMDGSYSLRLTSTAAGAVSAVTPLGTLGVAVVGGTTVRALASFHSPTTPRVCYVSMIFYDVTGTQISAPVSANVNSTLTGNGGQAFMTAVAPNNAVYAALELVGTVGATEALYVDQMLIGPGTSSVWSVGGFVGVTTVQVLRSDGEYVRTAGWPTDTMLTVPPVGQTVVVNDYEAAPGTAYTYTAVVSSGALSGTASTASNSVTISSNGYWWLLDPTNPEAVCVRFVMKSNWQPIIVESGATYKPVGNRYMIKSTDGTKGVGGIIPIYTGDSLADSQAAELTVQQTQPLCFITPTRGIYYVMSDPGTNQRGNVTPWWEVDQPQGEWQFYVVQTSRP